MGAAEAKEQQGEFLSFCKAMPTLAVQSQIDKGICTHVHAFTALDAQAHLRATLSQPTMHYKRLSAS